MIFIEAQARLRLRKYRYKDKQYSYQQLYIELPFWASQLGEQRVIVMPIHDFRMLLDYLDEKVRDKVLNENAAKIAALKLAHRTK